MSSEFPPYHTRESLELGLLVLVARALTTADARACFSVGEALATGEHFGLRVRKDLTRAAHFYEIAARQGDRDAQYELGFAYLQGEGVEQSAAEGLRWMTAAATEHHYVDAMRVLVDGYGKGQWGIEPNEALAEHWRARLQEQRRHDD